MSLTDLLLSAMREDRRATGIVFDAVYQPAGGVGGKVMPPTFPPINGSPYLFEDRWIDGTQTRTVVLDQVPSQANRVEEALLAARDSGKVDLPMFEMEVDGVRLTSLDFPHRYADAYLRDSEVDGVRFDNSQVGKALRSATAEDVRPLYEREPYSLLFGAWDSHRKGRWPKFARVYQSMMFGIDPLVGDRRGGRVDPLNLVGKVDSKDNAESDWKFFAEGEKARGQRLSEIGHGHIAPNPAHGGVTVREVRRHAWISFAALERLRFGDVSPEAAVLARAALAALAVAGDRLTFERPSIWLRSGCDLTRINEEVAFEVAGGGREPIAVTAADAIEAFVELRARAAAAGVAAATDVVPITPIKSLRDAIAYARTQATPDEEQ